MVAGSAVAAAFTSIGDLGWQRGFDRTSGVRSPLATAEDVLARGRTTYRARCQPCHGDLGRGNGPLGAALDPRPADLVLHVPQHTDGELAYFVSRGIPGTAMPAWRHVLSATERWEVVAYLRSLAAGD